MSRRNSNLPTRCDLLMITTIKAYMTFSYDPAEGCVLIYATTRNKARYISSNSLFCWDYDGINAIRKPKFDKYYNGVSVIETNKYLPTDAPDFYIDIDC